jgi:hypothetical protein
MGEKRELSHLGKQLRAEVGNDQAGTEQRARRKHPGEWALQTKMGKECSNHEHRDPNGTEKNNLQVVIEKHDGESKLENTDQVAKPFG